MPGKQPSPFLAGDAVASVTPRNTLRNRGVNFLRINAIAAAPGDFCVFALNVY